MNALIKKFERGIVIALVVMMILVILASTAELGWIIVKDLMRPPMFLLVIADLLEIFGFFLLVLIGIELLETIRAYIVDSIIHVEIVLEVALIAIARKVIILDVDKYSHLTVMGIAALILAMAAAIFAIKRMVKSKK